MNAMIPRLLQEKITNHLLNNKILILMGSKGVGKKKLILESIGDSGELLLFDANIKTVQKELAFTNSNKLIQKFEGKKFVLIEDAQYLSDIQQIIETILFGEENLTLILTCSFEPLLDDVLKEALQMQGLILTLYPPLFQEIANQVGIVEFDKTLPQRLVFGNYAEVITDDENKETFLMDLIDKAIFTNLSPNERINKGEKLLKMLQILAFEIGEPISYNDVGFRCGLDNETVERYIDLLQKAFILIKIPTYFNGHKYELKKAHAVYFYDNGIRNAIIRNFNEIDLRNDVDLLWKNWLIAERIKWNSQNNNELTYYFWRTNTKQQMDFIELKDNKVSAYKSIWDKRKKPKFPLSFKTAYPEAATHALNRSTYWGFLSKK